MLRPRSSRNLTGWRAQSSARRALLPEALADRIESTDRPLRNRHAFVNEDRLIVAGLAGFFHGAGIVVERDLTTSIVLGLQHNAAVALLDTEQIARPQRLDDR